MKRCLAMILTCALLLTVCPLEGLAAELDQKNQEAEADYIEQPIGEVEFQEEAPSPDQPEEPEEAPPEEPKAEPTTPEHEEVPKENAVQVQSTDTYTEGDYTYTVADGVATITKYTGSATTLTIPETLGGYAVQKISGYAFLDNLKIQRIRIPDSVTWIGEYAFAGCSNLESVKLSKGLTTLGYSAFRACNKLTAIEIPKSLSRVTVFNFGDDRNGAFNDCAKLKNVTFEKGTTQIANTLFKNCNGLEEIMIPNTVKTIEGNSFAGCSNLSKVLIPSSVQNFGNNIFGGSNKVTIYCDYNSYATLYAIDNNIPFQASGGFVGSEDSILNWNNSRYYADTNGISSNGYINMSVNYQVKDAWKDQVHDLVVKVNLPSTAELSEKTIRVDGVLCTNYTYNEKENTLNVPVTAKSGKVSFSVKKTSSGNLTSYVQFFFQRQNGWERDLLGIVNEPVKELTLHVSDTVGTPEVKVSGLAPASRQVDLYVDGKLSRSLQANKAGFYEGEVTLNNPENYTSYQITAKCKNDASEFSVSSEVMYQNEIPEMTGLKVKYNEHQVIKEQDLMNTNGKRPQIYFVPGTRFDFEATFSHPDVIDKVYVTSTRNNETKKLELVYDASKNAFCSNGYFDKNNRNYVPGTIGVEYSVKREEMSLDHQWDWNSLYDQLDESVRENSKVTKVKDTGTEKVFQIDLEDDVGNILEKGIEVGLKVLDDKDGTLFNEIDGMYSYGDLFGLLQDGDNFLSYVVPGYDKDKFFLTLDYKDPETISMIAYDTANSTFLELWFKAKNLDQVAEGLQAIKGPSKMIYKTYGIIGDYDDWVDQIYSNPNIADKVAAEQTAYDLKNARMMTLFISVVVPMCIMSGGATVPALLASGSVAIFGALADMMLKLGAGYLFWGEYGVKWVVDPSGYVYDAETHQRLEGVTVTAYGVEDDKSESFWTKPPASSPETLWDASQYNQSNPLLTNKDGKYAWDVPEGWWRVKYEKEGYITAWSDWLPVPPPQTEVNVGLQSQETKDFSIYLQDLEKQELTNGQLDLRFTLTNRTEQAKTVQFYVGAYTKEGKLLDGKLLSTTVDAASKREEPISLRLPEGTGISDLILKAFTLTDGTIVPMRKAWEYIYS